MSYFSHHPEAYDEICAKGIARKMTSYAGLDCQATGVDEEEIRSQFEAFISNLQCDTDPKMLQVYDALITWAQEEVNDQEQAFWERGVP
jgi:uncharacterized Fe-S cluster-containing MiaB family protein